MITVPRPEIELDLLFDELMNKVNELKPEDRSRLDRHYAILRTDIEKVYAYFHMYILNLDD